MRKPKPADLYMSAHRAHYRDKDQERALGEYRALIAAHPESPEAQLARNQITRLEQAKDPNLISFESVAVEEKIATRFRCTRCRARECQSKHITAPGADLSRLVEVQTNFYLAVACRACGYTELFDLTLLDKKGGLTDAVLDVLFPR